MDTQKELEIVRHSHMKYVEIFLVETAARQPHGHDDLEIGLLLEGEIILFLEQKRYELKKGDIFIINRYQMHPFFGTGSENLILVLQIQPEFYQQLNRQLTYLRFTDNLLCTGILHQKLTNNLLSCAELYFSEKAFSEIKTASLLLDALHLLLEAGKYFLTNERDYHLAQSNILRINRITEYIFEHHQEPLSLQTIASMENISACHVSHFITRTLGMSFQEYLNSIRFEHALRLVKQTDLNILNICMETGFSSSRYLNRMFEKNLGCTVKEYRKRGKKPLLTEKILPITNNQKRLSRESSALYFSKMKKPENQSDFFDNSLQNARINRDFSERNRE